MPYSGGAIAINTPAGGTMVVVGASSRAAGMPLHQTNGTNGNLGISVVLPDDGNIVIDRPDETPIWATNTVQP